MIFKRIARWWSRRKDERRFREFLRANPGSTIIAAADVYDALARYAKTGAIDAVLTGARIQRSEYVPSGTLMAMAPTKERQATG